MKIFKHRNIMGCIYGLVLAIPLLSILVRSAYVVVNKNAYQSAEITQTTYSRTPKYIQGDINNGLESDKIYHFETQYLSISDIVFEGEMIFEVVNGTFTSISSNETLIDEGIYVDNDRNSTIYVFNDADEMYIYVYNADLYYALYLEQTEFKFNGDILIQDLPTSYDISYFSNTTYQEYNYTEVESTTLDNVFEYSIDKTIEENNFGKLNFFNWFTNLFVNDNEVNNRYVGYVNWYMNYVMLVSCAYILFLVLMWFINFSRRLLERGMNYDW